MPDELCGEHVRNSTKVARKFMRGQVRAFRSQATSLPERDAIAVAHPTDPIPCRGNQPVQKIANRRRTKVPDPGQPTAPRQTLEDVKDSVTPLEQLSPLRRGSINENRVHIHRFGVISGYSLECFPL